MTNVIESFFLIITSVSATSVHTHLHFSMLTKLGVTTFVIEFVLS